jgi:hypothetical protein
VLIVTLCNLFISRLDYNIYFFYLGTHVGAMFLKVQEASLCLKFSPHHCNIVILIFIAFIKCRKYPVQRKTLNLKVPYFVKENFHTEYQGSLRRLEISVEEEYVTGLRQSCYREKNYRKYA